MTIIKPHPCISEFQDARYGKGLRIWTATLKGRRCTVCGVEVQDAESKLTTKKI